MLLRFLRLLKLQVSLGYETLRPLTQYETFASLNRKTINADEIQWVPSAALVVTTSALELVTVCDKFIRLGNILQPHATCNIRNLINLSNLCNLI